MNHNYNGALDGYRFLIHSVPLSDRPAAPPIAGQCATPAPGLQSTREGGFLERSTFTTRAIS